MLYWDQMEAGVLHRYKTNGSKATMENLIIIDCADDVTQMK